MSFAAERIFKAAIIALVIGAGVLLSSVLVDIIGQIPAAIDGEIVSSITGVLQKGREIANIFVPAKLFNIVIIAWLAVLPTAGTLYLGQKLYCLFLR